jgi:polysaccharide export outer membrane protein
MAVITVLFSCKPSQKSITAYRYFDKNIDSLNNIVLHMQEPRIQRHDQLSILISSATLNQEQAQVFNLLAAGGVAGGAGGGAAAGGGGGGAQGGYFVDFDGYIRMPIIGKMRAEGLTKTVLADTIAQRLQPYVKNPVVNIRYANFRVMMMGEVGEAGWQSFANEKATIVDAIGQAGGLNETAKRDSILLIRTQPDGTLETHRVNLNDALIFDSPYFQLQQNDIVYVLPNDSKLIIYERNNSPFFRDLPVYLGLITSILAFGTLIISLTR